MTETTRTYVATIAGAMVGGLAGYLLFTERGRSLRQQLAPAMEDVVGEIDQLRATLTKMSGMASDGWKYLNDALGEGGPRGTRYPDPRQTSPF